MPIRQNAVKTSSDQNPRDLGVAIAFVLAGIGVTAAIIKRIFRN